jgi:endonuclease/exonuclease/phosphatase family metal-dependent hydrolase
MTQSAPTIRVLTWNVHGCVGRDGVRDPNRVARVLEAAQPDVSALQEIDSRTRAAANDPFSYFGDLFGWTSVSARTLSAKDGHYGHIVLSRWPIESLGEIDLSVRWSEPRKAIVGAISTPAGRVIVIAVHLGLLPFERRKQFARLRERIHEIAERPLIVLGDFNDFPGRRLNERSLARSLVVTPPLPTYPSRFPLLPLDRIWFSAPLALVTAATLNDAEHVSDHLPLVASLRLEGHAPGTALASP